jgi:hypothetical protein
MEQLIFFVLGVVTVLIIYGVVVMVRVQQKNGKLESDLTNAKDAMENNFSELRRHVDELDKIVNLRLEREMESVHRNFDDVYRTIDSRTDKLSSRFDNELKDVYQEIGKVDTKLINHKINS